MIPLDGQPILTAAAMRAAEAASGHSTKALMIRAGAAVAEQVRRLAMGSEVLIACGPGNNGGDGYVAATILKRAGVPVRVAATSEPATDAARHARVGWDGPVDTLAQACPAHVLVDALFGTGLTRPLDGTTVAGLHRLHAAAHLSIAVDVPSGVGTDDGICLSDIPTFDLILALGHPKPAHVLQPAASRARAIRVLDIGVSGASDLTVLQRPPLGKPSVNVHKYSRGLVAVVAGTMPGAAALVATAAARSGSGYVLLLGSSTDRLPHAIVRRRYEAGALHEARIGALVIGPGLGRNEAARTRLGEALATTHPLVLDGDALALLDLDQLGARQAPAILTPHAGEFTRLFGEDHGSKVDRALEASRRSGATIVFKGADTVIAHPDGRVRVAVDQSSWLSTAGTGDTLAGIVAARLAGGADPFAAACEGVWLHGEAARLAGPAFVADDLAAFLPQAVATCL